MSHNATLGSKFLYIINEQFHRTNTKSVSRDLGNTVNSHGKNIDLKANGLGIPSKQKLLRRRHWSILNFLPPSLA